MVAPMTLLGTDEHDTNGCLPIHGTWRTACDIAGPPGRDPIKPSSSPTERYCS